MYKIIAILIALVVSFFVGKYNGVKSVSIDTKKQEIKAEESKKIDKHVKTVITEKKNKDGSVEKVTVIDNNTNVESKVDSVKKEITVSKQDNKVKILGFTGYDFNDKAITYGVGVTTQLIGPFDIGVFGFNNKTFGLTIGMEL